MRVSEILAGARLHECGGKLPSPHIHSEDLERFALGKVDQDERARIAGHIRMCEYCREQLDNARWFAFRLKRTQR